MLENKAIEDYCKEYMVEWATVMPAGCPPRDICFPHGHLFYRLAINKDTYSDEDFRTYADINPRKDWGDMLPLAVGLSVIEDESKARRSMKLPYLKRFKGVICLCLNPMDGVVKQTGVHKSHYTWWRTKSFNTTNLRMLEL